MASAIPVAGTDSAGRAMTAVTIGNVTLPPGSTPQQRFEAIVKAGVQPNQGGHTPSTVARMQSGDAAAAVDQKALTALKAQYSELPATERETYRDVFQADLKAIYSGQPPSGELKTALVKSERDQRTRDALNAALKENRSPAELKAIIDGAQSGAPKSAQVHVTGQDALTLLTRGFAAMPPEQQRAAKETFERGYAAIRRDGHAIRTVNGRLEVYNPADSREIAGQPRDDAGRFVKPEGTPDQRAAEAAPPTPEQWEAGHASVTNAEGYMPLERINKAGLSGYSLPNLAPGQSYPSSVFAELAAARAAGITQQQIDAFVADGMRRKGYIK